MFMRRERNGHPGPNANQRGPLHYSVTLRMLIGGVSCRRKRSEGAILRTGDERVVSSGLTRSRRLIN